MRSKDESKCILEDLSAVVKYSSILDEKRNIHSAPPGSLLTGTIHSLELNKSRPSSHKARPCTSSASEHNHATSNPLTTAPSVDIEKIVKLVEETFPPWTSEYLPNLPNDDRDILSLSQYQQRKADEAQKYRQWNDEKKRHEVFLRKVRKCFTVSNAFSVSTPKNSRYAHIESKHLQKKSEPVPASSSSPSFTLSISNEDGSQRRKNSLRRNSLSSGSNASRLKRVILPSQFGQSLIHKGIDLTLSIHSAGYPKEEYMAPEGLPPKSFQKVMDLYNQYRPEISEFETFDFRLLHSILKKAPHQRSKADIQTALPELMKMKDFRKFSEFFASELLSVMYLEELNDSTCVFKQGDVGTAWFAILFGAVQIFVSSTGSLMDMKPVRILTAGSGFGEVALMSNKPRMATVITIAYTVLARVEKEHYSRIMKIAYDQELSVKVNFFSRVPCFETWSDNAIHSIGEVATWKECEDGEVIFREGDEVDSIFFIKSGQVHCYRRLKEKMVQVAELERNGYFNEYQMVTKEGKGYRALITAKAKGVVKLACIAIQDAKSKFAFELSVHPMYQYSEKMLEKLQQEFIEKVKWDKLKRKEMDRMAKEKLKNPCTNWHEFVMTRAQRTKKISKKDQKKKKKADTPKNEKEGNIMSQ